MKTEKTINAITPQAKRLLIVELNLIHFAFNFTTLVLKYTDHN